MLICRGVFGRQLVANLTFHSSPQNAISTAHVQYLQGRIWLSSWSAPLTKNQEPTRHDTRPPTIMEAGRILE